MGLFKEFYLNEAKPKYFKQDFENYGFKGIDPTKDENQKKFQFMLDKAKEMGLEHLHNKTWREMNKGKHAKVYHFSWAHSDFG